jgi:hypothetical protein
MADNRHTIHLFDTELAPEFDSNSPLRGAAGSVT